MSYDCRVINKKTKKPLEISSSDIRDYGGTIQVSIGSDGTFTPEFLTQLRFNVTYNYYNLLCFCFNTDKSIRELYGKDLNECLKIIDNGIQKITTSFSPKKLHKNYCTVPVDEILKWKKPLHNEKDYWCDSPSNVLKTLNHIREIIVTALPYNKRNCLTIDGD